ncbi:MAG: amino acid permease [Chitinispirillia bacterium]|nr:amino acid permease [Chitinispirillia bacterium]MCL2241669.1 amino acid permease [Chitinispirillia bacterium]
MNMLQFPNPAPPQGQNGAPDGAGPAVAQPELKKFSTFDGVFTPTILTILGVVMFMRAGFVVGHAGIYGALAILIIAKSITTLTGLSISAIATNTEVKGGGTYYLISRSLGPEFGGAIAITIFLAQTLSIPFYLLGIAEAVVHTFPQLNIYFDIIAYSVFAFLALFSLKGAGVVMKFQFVIMGILILSIASFIIGAALNFNPGTFAANTAPLEGSPFPFWALFAIYFPAVTGILSGVNMSGDLKNPTRSIPFGALAAILTGFVIYTAQIILWGGASSREELTGDSYKTLTGLWPYFTTVLVVAGMFAASVSNILSTILGTPRVLQALAQDKLLKPLNIFAKMTENGEPRRALMLVFAICITVLYIACRGGGSGGGALNVMARVVAMLFLWTYGIINLAAFVESFSRNPSFRPRFKFFHWSAALVGAIACFSVTFIIDTTAALLAALVLAGLFFYVQKYVMSASFGDARRGFIYSRTRNNLLTLSSLPVHAKNWRPTVAAFIGDPEHRSPLLKYADWLSSGRGIMTIASLIKGEFAEKKETRAYHLAKFNELLAQQRIKAFPEVLVTPDYNTGVDHFLQANSIGPIKPNLAIFGWSRDPARAQQFVDGIRTAASLNMSIGLICGRELPEDSRKERRNRRIDIWWRGERNGSLMVILAHLLSLNPEWSGAKIRILRLVNAVGEMDAAHKDLERLIEAARMDVAIETILTDDTFPNMLRRQSGLSTVIFMGFNVNDKTDPVNFQKGFTDLLQGMPTTVLIQSTGEADLLS